MIFNKGHVPEEEYTIPFGQADRPPGYRRHRGRHRLDGGAP
ncbi:MAG: hypothetical protein R2911_43910 [Caldilineaceae bacterium]